jgi:hypothetical protein
LALVELRRFFVEHLIEIPDDGVSVESAAVVELDITA